MRRDLNAEGQTGQQVNQPFRAVSEYKLEAFGERRLGAASGQGEKNLK
jgi:hypothetical protein